MDLEQVIQSSRVVTRREPKANQWDDLLFAWAVAKHVTSNGIVVARSGVTLGIGQGQVSRIDAVNIALAKAGEQAKGAVLASDGFLPFDDSVRSAAAGRGGGNHPAGWLAARPGSDRGRRCRRYGVGLHGLPPLQALIEGDE